MTPTPPIKHFLIHPHTGKIVGIVCTIDTLYGTHYDATFSVQPPAICLKHTFSPFTLFHPQFDPAFIIMIKPFFPSGQPIDYPSPSPEQNTWHISLASYFSEQLAGWQPATSPPSDEPDPQDTAAPYTDPHKFTDVMIDVETVADTPHAAPTEFGITFFDRDCLRDRNPPADLGDAILSFHYPVAAISAIRLGMHINENTMAWRLTHGLHTDLHHGEPLHEAIAEILRDFTTHTDPAKVRVWSRGNAFDLAILRNACRLTGYELPYRFWNDRDVRTWLEACRYKSTRVNNHDALDDSKNQALDVIEATAALHRPPAI